MFTPKVGQKAIIKEHQTCHHIGIPGVITHVRSDRVLISFEPSVYAMYNGHHYNYWCPILLGETQTGEFRHFSLVSEEGSPA
jgi:hypothetical protein